MMPNTHRNLIRLIRDGEREGGWTGVGVSGSGGGVTHVEVLALSVTGKRVTPRLPPEQQVLKILSLQWEPARENELVCTSAAFTVLAVSCKKQSVLDVRKQTVLVVKNRLVCWM